MGLRDGIALGFDRLCRVIARRPWVTLVCMAIATAALAAGLPRLRVEASGLAYLPPGDPAQRVYDRFRADFPDDNAVLVLLAGDPGRGVFTFGHLERLRALHRDLERELPRVDEVHSLLDARVTRGDVDGLAIEEFLDPWPETGAELDALRDRALAHPLYRGSLIAADGSHAAIVVTARPGPRADADPDMPAFLDGDELTTVLEGLLRIVARHDRPDAPIHVTGNPALSYGIMKDMEADMALFSGLSVALIALLLLALFRRLSGLFLPLLVVVLPLTATFGLMGWAGLPITPSTQILPSFLLAVCVGDAVHVLSVFYQRLDGGHDRHEAIAHALAHSGLAVVMTSVTTAGSLASFTTAGLGPIVGLGLAAPAGVLFALVYSVVLLPALVTVLPLAPRPARTGARTGAGAPAGPVDRGLVALGDLSTRHPRRVLGAWLAVIAVSALALTQLRFRHDPLRWFGEDNPARVATEVANEVLGGAMNLELTVDTGVANGLYEPDVLRRLDAMQAAARATSVEDVGVGHASSLVDVVAEVHGALHAGVEGAGALPASRALVAQELLLFEQAGSDDAWDWASWDLRRARLSLRVPFRNALLYPPLTAEIERKVRGLAGDDLTVEVTGLIMLFIRTIDALLASMATSYSLAIAVIAVLMVLLVGELRLGLASLLPNLAPIVIALGAMQAFDVPLDMFTILIGSIAIGVAVDDTVHLMHGVQRRRAAGAAAPVALRETLVTTGRAMLISSIALTAGFAVFALGSMDGVVHFGLVTAFAIALALLADLTLAPAIVVLLAGESPGPPSADPGRPGR